MSDAKNQLKVCIQFLHDVYAVALYTIRPRVFVDVGFSHHFARNSPDLMYSVDSMDAALKAILFEEALRSTEALHLSLDDKFLVVISAELPRHSKCFLLIESHLTQRDRDMILVHELGR